MGQISLEGVCKRYDRRGDLVVRDLDLSIADGQYTVLVGPSGCGKTTLRLIAGLESLTAGRIRINGRDMSAIPPRERDVTMVFQDFALYPHLTARRNMEFPLRMRRTPREEMQRRVHDAAEMLGISGLLDRKPGTLSGGERQRVALGRAIVRHPEATCTLLDEPLSNLDAVTRTQLRAEVRALHARLRLTALHVTHDQEEAMLLGDRIAVMHSGSLQQIGSPDEIYFAPTNRFVAGFFGNPAMNFIEGRMESVDGATVFRDGSDDAGVSVRLAHTTLDGRSGESGGAAVVLGVRPESVRESDADGSAGNLGAIDMQVQSVEMLGAQMNVRGRMKSGQEIVARVRSRAGVRPGERITWRVDPKELSLFEPGPMGRRIG